MTGDRPRLSLFGGFSLAHADGRAIPVNLRKGEALLAFLAVADRQSASRELLASLLWGEFEQQRARQSLRQVLLALTKSLAGAERQILHIDSQQVSIRPDALSVDAVAFEQLATDASFESLSRAVALYRGDFLAGLRLDAPDFEDWIGATRSRFQDRAVQALLGLLDHQERAEDITPAVATANQVLRIEPYREDIHRRLMGIYLRVGMRSSALAQYRACRDILQRELGVEPDARTMELYAGILAQAPSVAESAISGAEAPSQDLVAYGRGLGDQARCLLDAACIAGHRSSCAVVARAAGLSEAEAARALEELIAGGLVAVEGEDILFLDPADREALYDRLVPPRRRRGHAEVAEAIQALHGGMPEPHFQVLAHHLRQAGRPRGALKAAVRAAAVESKRGDHGSARRILLDARAALEALQDANEILPVELDIDLALGGLAEAAGDLEEALRFLKLAEGLAGRLGDSGKLAESLVVQSRVQYRAGRRAAAHEAVRRGLALAERSGCQSVWLPVENLLARLHLVGGEGHGAGYRVERRIQRDAVLGLKVDQAEATALLAVLKAARGRFDEALRECRAATALAEAAGCEAALAACHEAQGLVLLWQGGHGAARDCLETALRYAEARGDLPRIYLLGGFRALALIAGGREPDGIEALGGTVAMAERLKTRFLLPLFKACLAEATAAAGKGDEAAGTEAYRFAAAANDPWAGSVALRAVAVASLQNEAPDPERAEAAVAAAVAAQKSLGLAFELTRSLAVQASVFEAKGMARGAVPPPGPAEHLAVRS